MSGEENKGFDWEKTKKILLVDDERNFGTALEAMLRYSSYNFYVDYFQDPQEALNRFRESENEFDLIISDVMMPNMNGYDLVKKIREINTKIPVIFLTAKDTKEDQLKGLELGEYLIKPIDPDILIARLNKYLNLDAEVDHVLYHIGDAVFNSKKRTILFKKKSRQETLSPKASALFELLCEGKDDNVPVTRAFVSKQLWGISHNSTNEEDAAKVRSIDVYINKIRGLFKENDPKVEIKNVHGLGFYIEINEGAEEIIKEKIEVKNNKKGEVFKSKGN